jgi:signal peptide peptidase SppA
MDQIGAGAITAKEKPRDILALDIQEEGYSPIGAHTAGDIRVIPIQGAMMKQFSKYGGTSYMAIRQELRGSARSSSIKGIMLLMDTPGGNVSGLDDLALDITMAANAKPLMAHIDDCCCSAGVWLSSQAPIVAANRSAMVGSIGVFTVLEDTSAAAEADGVKVIKVSSTPAKGEGTPGLPITEDYIAEVQRQVDEINGMFLAAISKGRGLAASALGSVADGRTFNAQVAKDSGLIDRIQSFDESMAQLTEIVRKAEATAQDRSRAASAKIKIAQLKRN